MKILVFFFVGSFLIKTFANDTKIKIRQPTWDGELEECELTQSDKIAGVIHLKKANLCSRSTAEILIALEDSWEITISQENLMKSHINNLIQRLDLGRDSGKTRVGYFTYDSKVDRRNVIPFYKTVRKRTHTRNLDGLELLRKPKRTNVTAALEFAREEFLNSRGNARKFLILFGRTKYRGVDKTKFEHITSKMRKNEGFVMMNIHVGSIDEGSEQQENIRALVSKPRAIHSMKIETETLYGRIEDNILHGCIKCHRPGVDLVFVLDNSRTIPSFTFEDVTRFIRRLLRKVDMGRERNQFRMAFVLYGDQVDQQASFGFNEHTNPDSVFRNLRRITTFGTSTSTYTGRALRYTLDTIFANDVSRPNAKKVILLFTDSDIRPDRNDAIQYTKEARRAGIKTFALNLRTNKNRAGTDLSKLSGSRWYTLSATRIFNPITRGDLVTKLLRRICISVL